MHNDEICFCIDDDQAKETQQFANIRHVSGQLEKYLKFAKLGKLRSKLSDLTQDKMGYFDQNI